VVNTADLPENFQMTELGPLPKEWRVVRLGDLVEREILLMRNGFPQGQHNETGVGVPHLRPFNITNDGILDLSQIKFVAPPSDDDPRWLHPGDVIFNNTNSEELVGKTALFNRNGRFVLSNHMTFLRVLEPGQIDPYWLARLLHLFWYLGMYRALGRRHVNQVSISLERLKGVRIPLPPLDEQRAIAHVLRTVQRAKEATEGVIAALKELKKSLMQHLFTYGPVPVTERERVPLQETEIGPIPAHWRVVRLGEVVKLTKGRKPDELIPKYQFGALPYLTADYFRNRLPTEWVPAQYLSKLPLCSKEDVVLIWDGSKAGQVFIGLEGVLASTMVRIDPVDPEKQMERHYLYYFLLTQFNLLNNKTTGTTIPHVNKEVFRNLPIPLPPLAEQREIARMLQVVDAKIAAEERRRAALEDLFKTLLHELMSGRRRVSLATQSLGE
jgi:type I restriction enzyme S subunit